MMVVVMKRRYISSSFKWSPLNHRLGNGNLFENHVLDEETMDKFFFFEGVDLFTQQV